MPLPQLLILPLRLQRKMLLQYKRERGGGTTTREGQQEIERGAAGEPGTGTRKKSAKGEVNGAKNTAAKEAKKNLAKNKEGQDNSREGMSTNIVILI